MMEVPGGRSLWSPAQPPLPGLNIPSSLPACVTPDLPETTQGSSDKLVWGKPSSIILGLILRGARMVQL